MFHPVALGAKNNHSERAIAKSLLIGNAFVDGHEDFELPGDCVEQFRVLEVGPTKFARTPHVVTTNVRNQQTGDTAIEQNPHRYCLFDYSAATLVASANAAFRANSRTATA